MNQTTPKCNDPAHPRRPNEIVDGRGAGINPGNRFEALHYEVDDDVQEYVDPSRPVQTQFLRDDSQSIISYNNSPDIGFDASLNPYRGCEHGCAYCYARPTHEYLGFSAGLDFETKIMVKPNAAQLLTTALNKRNWKPQLLALSGVTDAYQPIERKLRITRACLEVLAAFRNPVAVITKNYLVTRDIDLLSSLAQEKAAGVSVSITTLDAKLAQILEPRASLPKLRLQAIAELAKAGIPVGVNVAPIIPGLNDHEIPAILAAAAEAGAQSAFYTIIRLPLTVAPVFVNWLENHFPDRKERILGRIKSMRNGKLNNPEFGRRMRGDGPIADEIQQLFRIICQRHSLNKTYATFETAAFRRIDPNQPEFF
jgi:DNA repair photolyase